MNAMNQLTDTTTEAETHYAKLWVTLTSDAKNYSKFVKIQRDLLERTDHGLRCEDNEEDGYYDVTAIGTLKNVIAYIRAKEVKGCTVDITDDNFSVLIKALGCSSELVADDMSARYELLGECPVSPPSVGDAIRLLAAQYGNNENHANDRIVEAYEIGVVKNELKRRWHYVVCFEGDTDVTINASERGVVWE